jgi:hypothetical protein
MSDFLFTKERGLWFLMAHRIHLFTFALSLTCCIILCGCSVPQIMICLWSDKWKAASSWNLPRKVSLAEILLKMWQWNVYLFTLSFDWLACTNCNILSGDVSTESSKQFSVEKKLKLFPPTESVGSVPLTQTVLQNCLYNAEMNGF